MFRAQRRQAGSADPNYSFAREASPKGTDLANSLARKAGQQQARFASGFRCRTAFPLLAHRGKKRLQLHTFHFSHIHDCRTLFVCASQREVQDSACRQFAGQPPKSSSHLLEVTGGTQESAWVRRKPRTSRARKGSRRRRTPPHDARALTRRATQYQVDRTPVRGGV